VFQPLDFLSRLAALVAAARVKLTRFDGVFAQHHRLRAQIAPARSSLERAAGQAGRACGKALGWAQRLKRPRKGNCSEGMQMSRNPGYTVVVRRWHWMDASKVRSRQSRYDAASPAADCRPVMRSFRAI
jgi:hypothetical protein